MRRTNPERLIESCLSAGLEIRLRLTSPGAEFSQYRIRVTRIAGAQVETIEQVGHTMDHACIRMADFLLTRAWIPKNAFDPMPEQRELTDG